MATRFLDALLLTFTTAILLVAGWDLPRIVVTLMILSLLVFPVNERSLRHVIIIMFSLSVFSFLIHRSVVGEQLAVVAFILLAAYFLKQLFTTGLNE